MLVFGSHVQTLFVAIMFCRTAALDLLLGFFCWNWTLWLAIPTTFLWSHFHKALKHFLKTFQYWAGSEAPISFLRYCIFCITGVIKADSKQWQSRSHNSCFLYLKTFQYWAGNEAPISFFHTFRKQLLQIVIFDRLFKLRLYSW